MTKTKEVAVFNINGRTIQLLTHGTKFAFSEGGLSPVEIDNAKVFEEYLGKYLKECKFQGKTAKILLGDDSIFSEDIPTKGLTKETELNFINEIPIKNNELLVKSVAKANSTKFYAIQKTYLARLITAFDNLGIKLLSVVPVSETEASLNFIHQEKKSFGAKYFIILGIVTAGIFIGLGGLYVKTAQELILPLSNESTATKTTPSKQLTKATIKLKISNAGLTLGQATDVEKGINSLGYSNTLVGEFAGGTQIGTTITAKTSVPKEYLAELQTYLKKTFIRVTTLTKDVQAEEIEIIIGVNP